MHSVFLHVLGIIPSCLLNYDEDKQSKLLRSVGRGGISVGVKQLSHTLGAVLLVGKGGSGSALGNSPTRNGREEHF